MRSARVPLRNEFDRDLAGDHLPLRDRIGADVRSNHARDAACVDEFADSHAGPRRVIADHRQAARARRAMSASMIRSGAPTFMKPPSIRLAPSGPKAAAAAAEMALCMTSVALSYDIEAGADIDRVADDASDPANASRAA